VTRRLGSTSGAAEVMAMEFFASLDFNRILAKEYEAEFKPPAAGGETGENFDDEFTTQQVIDEDDPVLLCSIICTVRLL
jgi:hypothetical protein